MEIVKILMKKQEKCINNIKVGKYFRSIKKTFQ